MFDGEALGDHGLAVVVGTSKQQTAWAQGWRSLKLQSHRVMRRADRRMTDPARRAHMGDPHCVIGLQEWDGSGHEVVRHLTNPRQERSAAGAWGRALPGPRRKAQRNRHKVSLPRRHAGRGSSPSTGFSEFWRRQQLRRFRVGWLMPWCRVDVNSESQWSCKIKVWPLTLIVPVVRRRMIWNRRPDFGAEGSGSSGSGYAACR